MKETNGGGRNGLHVEVKKPEQTTRVMSRMSGKVFDEAAVVATHLLQACECRGHFLLRVRDHCVMKGQAKARVKYAIGQAIRMTLKPGDNGTAWEYDLVPPTDTDAYELCKQLQRYLSKPKGNSDTPPEEDEVQQNESVGERTADESPSPSPSPSPPPVAVAEPAKPQVQKTLLQRVSELEQQRLRIEERKSQLSELDRRKAALMAQVKAIDDEAMKIMEEDERDTEAMEAKEILDNLEKLFMKG